MCAVIELVMFILDLAKGIYAAYQHYDKGDMWWMGWTIAFMCITSVAASILCIHLVYKYCESSAWCCYILLLIVFTPIAPFILLVWNMCDPNRPVARSVGAMKLIKAIFESMTMASLQMHIVFQSLVEMPDGYLPHRQMKLVEALPNVEHWQLVTITVSIIVLAYSVSTNIVFEKAEPGSKVAFFFVGLFSLTSRIMVYCLFSMVYSPLFYAPLFAQWIIYLIFMSSCFKSEDDTCRAFVLSLAVPFDNFTLGGTMISLANVGFAVWGYFLNSGPPVAIAAIVLSTISFLFNLVFTSSQDCKDIGDDWSSALEYRQGYDLLAERSKKGHYP